MEIYEELLIRGYLMKNIAEWLNHPKISKRTALAATVIITSVLFGFLHLGNPNSSAISTINIILAGISLSLGILLNGELSLPIGLHISWNFFQGAVFGFPVSSVTTPSSLISFRQSGLKAITGGAFGPEAGLIGVAALITRSILTVFWFKKRKGEIKISGRFSQYRSHRD